MQSTGIVPSSPTTACEVPKASWIDGIRGPTPTICGRSVSAARKSATRVAAGRCVTRTSRAGEAEASPLTLRAASGSGAPARPGVGAPLRRRTAGSAGSRRAPPARPRRRSARRGRSGSRRRGPGGRRTGGSRAPPARAGPACRRRSATASASPSFATQVTARTTVMGRRPQMAPHQLRGDLDVLAGFAGRRRGVSVADRVDQLHVALGRLRRLHVDAVERDRDPALDPERRPALLEHRVAGRLDDSRWNAMSCWASAFVSPARTASFMASSSNSSAETSPPSFSAASRAASSSSEARTGKTSISSSSSTTRTREPRNGSDSTRRISWRSRSASRRGPGSSRAPGRSASRPGARPA